jgi:hypothetical protein
VRWIAAAALVAARLTHDDGAFPLVGVVVHEPPIAVSP